MINVFLLLWVAEASRTSCVMFRPSLSSLFDAGPYATVTDVRNGTICSIDDKRAHSLPLPPECECKFQRLAAHQEECATLGLQASDEEKEVCSRPKCELCCILKTVAIPIPEEDRSQLECRKMCPNSDEIVLDTEDMTTYILKAMMEYTETFYVKEPHLTPSGITSTLSSPSNLAGPPPTTSSLTDNTSAAPIHEHGSEVPTNRVAGPPVPAVVPSSSKANYPILHLPSEEDLAAAGLLPQGVTHSAQ